MKRQRGRSRRNNNQHNANRSMESNGPDVKVRGTAKQIFDKYEGLARDAASSGNRVKAENFRQHAEHYLRIVNVNLISLTKLQKFLKRRMNLRKPNRPESQNLRAVAKRRAESLPKVRMHQPKRLS